MDDYYFVHADEIDPILAKLSDEGKRLYSLTPEVSMRTKTLFQIAYEGAESGLTNHEIIVLVCEKGLEWGKFKDNNMYFMFRRAIEMVHIARNKYPSE